MTFDLGTPGDPNAGFDVFQPMGTAKNLSPWPVLIAGAALLVSMALMFVGKAWPLPAVGWLLTPFVVVGCLGWGRAQFIKNSADPWFDRDRGRGTVRVLQALTLVAFIASIPHIWRMGQEAALWMQ